MATIKGKWRFNEEIDLSSWTTQYEEQINFLNVVWGSLNGYCKGLRFYSSGLAYIGIEEEPNASIPDIVEVYNTQYGWLRPGHDLVDFQEEQEITELLYHWIITNAKPQVEISGCWKLKSDISLPEIEINERITCGWSAIGRDSVDGIQITSEGIKCRTKIFPVQIPLSQIAVADGHAWDFGPVTKYVSVDFFDFLQKNAEEVNWEDQIEKIIGFWKIADRVKGDTPTGFITPFLIKIGDLQTNYLWYSPEEKLIGVLALPNAFYGEQLFSLFNPIYEEQWLDGSQPGQSYQYWDFGESAHDVPKLFYNWLTQNGSQITDAVGTIEINGAVVQRLTNEQVAELHCQNKIMNSDIKVGIHGDHLIKTQPLVTFKEGEFDKGIKYEERSFWLSDQVWEETISLGSYPVGFKKLGTLPDDNYERGIFGGPTASILAVGQQESEGVISYYRVDNLWDFVNELDYEPEMLWISAAILYCLNAQQLNDYFQTNYFENGGIYLHNLMFIEICGGREGVPDCKDIQINVSLPVGEEKVLFDEVIVVGSGSGILEITQNGVVDVSLYKEVSVQVQNPVYEGGVRITKW